MKGEGKGMKRRWLFVMAALFFVVGLALMLTAPAQAVEISNLSGQSCGDGCGTWHFVNNQTGDAAAGTLTATFSDSVACLTGPAKVLSNTQHFICGGCGDLTGASTNLPGRLVLSDFTCEAKPPPPPPPCNPKTDPTCK
jgi:hypothetical protein